MTRNDFNSQMQRMRSLRNMADVEILDSYWQVLQNWELNDLRQVITVVLQEDEKFPKLGRLKEVKLSQSHQHPSPFAIFRCQKCINLNLHQDDFRQFDFVVRINQFDIEKSIRCNCDGNLIYPNIKCCHANFNGQYLQSIWEKREQGLNYAII